MARQTKGFYQQQQQTQKYTLQQRTLCQMGRRLLCQKLLTPTTKTNAVLFRMLAIIAITTILHKMAIPKPPIRSYKGAQRHKTYFSLN